MTQSKKNGYFTVFVGKDNQYYFNLKAGNHEIILQSEGYVTKSNALNGIRSVQENCLEDARFVRKSDKNGNPFFVLTAKNGKTIGKGEDYSSEQMMEKGIDSVMKNGTSHIIKGCEDDTIVIKVNKKPYTVSKNSMNGSEILSLAGLAASGYCLFLQQEGKQIEVKADKDIVLIDGMCFQAIVNDIKFG